MLSSNRLIENILSYFWGAHQEQLVFLVDPKYNLWHYMTAVSIALH